MKYKIVMIDDEKAQIKELSELLKSYSDSSENAPSFETETFSSGDEFIENGRFDADIAFIDVNMPGSNGFVTAKALREHNPNAVIVFIARNSELAINGYEVRALDYLIKPVTKPVFDKTLNEAITTIKKNFSKKIAIENSSGIFLFDVSDIVYIEIKLHNLFFNVMSCEGKIETYRMVGSLKVQRERLEKYNFGQCMACYLVNFRHIRSITKREVRLSGNVSLPISRKFHRSFSDKFLEYVD